MKENSDDVEVVEYTVRAPCRACGRLYVWPKGSKAPGGIGPCCQSGLWDEGAGRAVDIQPGHPGLSVPTAADDFAPSSDSVVENLQDVLCEGCRDRLAAGRLVPPGTPLCVPCADEVIEHWLAWLDDPGHEWWPSDDPFGSARRPVRDWRAMGGITP